MPKNRHRNRYVTHILQKYYVRQEHVLFMVYVDYFYDFLVMEDLHCCQGNILMYEEHVMQSARYLAKAIRLPV